MNARQKKLLSMLLANSHMFFRIKELQKSLNCSEKTVRNDLNQLEDFLKTYKGASLIRKRGTGIALEVTEAAQADIFQNLYYVPSKTKEERVIEVAYHLLTSSQPVTLKELAEKYFTNSADIRRDMDQIEEWLSPFHLRMMTRQRVGSIVQGEEFSKRNALAHLSELVSSQDNRDYVLNFFPDNEINAVKKAIRDAKHHYHLELSDGRFESLLIHALIMIKRTRQGTPVVVAENDAQSTLTTKEYEVTTYILNKLERMLRLVFPENERIYYAWHVSSAIPHMRFEEKQSPSQFTEETVTTIIKKVQRLTHVPFDEDKVLVDGLMIHMDAVLKRLSYGLHISNPMLHDIKKLYPYLFSMVVFALNEFKNKHDITIPEEEAAYLVLHFQAAIERMEKQQTPQRVLVVCHMGIGMSRLLEAKLEQQYKGLTITACIAKNELNAYLKCDMSIDFIISTVPLPVQDIPNVVISPLLNEADKKKLNQFVQEGKQEVKSSRYPVLHQFIKNGLFQKDLQLTHPFEVVERLANQLVRLNLVEESFTHHVLLRERASFTSIGGKIAIPHAQPRTVKQSTVLMAVLKEPIEWGQEMVSLVFLLAINEVDRQMTPDLLKEISNLSQDPVLIDHMLTADNKEDVEKLIE